MKTKCSQCQFAGKKEACVEHVKNHPRVYAGECWVPADVFAVYDERSFTGSPFPNQQKESELLT